jgi:hypothetical protein
MKICDHCGEELEFVTEYDYSTYYICPGCKTLWDYMEDSFKNEEIAIDVQAVLNDYKRRKVAS